MTLDQETKPASRKASELKRQSKKLERHDYVRSILNQAMDEAENQKQFEALLTEKNFVYYRRGKHHGVEVIHPDGLKEKYRFATLGIAQKYDCLLYTSDAADD